MKETLKKETTTTIIAMTHISCSTPILPYYAKSQYLITEKGCCNVIKFLFVAHTKEESSKTANHYSKYGIYVDCQSEVYVYPFLGS